MKRKNKIELEIIPEGLEIPKGFNVNINTDNEHVSDVIIDKIIKTEGDSVCLVR